MFGLLKMLFGGRDDAVVLKEPVRKQDRHDLGFKGDFIYTCRVRCLSTNDVSYVRCQTTHSKERPIYRCPHCGRKVELSDAHIETDYTNHPATAKDFQTRLLMTTDYIHKTSIDEVHQSYVLDVSGNITARYKDGELERLKTPL